MSYKQHLLKNYNTIYKAKTLIDTLDPKYIDHKIINAHELDQDTLSVVMTTYNRSIQTYFTLLTIAKSSYKNIQVIIVDDSTTDKVTIDQLSKLGLHIELISIKDKFWFNPCVNYNIAFKYIKGSKVIIQNAEVCHIGDVIDYTVKNLLDNEYLVFDVSVMESMDDNLKLHSLDTNFSNNLNISKLYKGWYQHHSQRNRCLHFLTAITKQDLDKVGGFDLDYTVGSWYDDDDLLFRIRANGILVNSISHQDKEVYGIHQWHISSGADWDKHIPKNGYLFNFKQQYFAKHEKFFHLTDYPDDLVEIIIERLL